MKHIGLCSLIASVIIVVIFFATFSALGGDYRSFWIGSLLILSLVGGIVAIVQHKSKLDTAFGIISIMIPAGLLVLLIFAAAAFHD